VSNFLRWVTLTRSRMRISRPLTTLCRRGICLPRRFKSFPVQDDSAFPRSCGTFRRKHALQNWSSAQRELRWGSSCSVGFSRVNLCHYVVPMADWPVRANWVSPVQRRASRPDKELLCGFAASIRRGSPQLDAKIGLESIAVRLDLEFHNLGHADARKRAPYQAISTK